MRIGLVRPAVAAAGDVAGVVVAAAAAAAAVGLAVIVADVVAVAAGASAAAVAAAAAGTMGLRRWSSTDQLPRRSYCYRVDQTLRKHCRRSY